MASLGGAAVTTGAGTAGAAGAEAVGVGTSLAAVFGASSTPHAAPIAVWRVTKSESQRCSECGGECVSG